MLKRVALFFILGVAVIVAVYLAFVFEWSYSSGERAGWLQKFSRKGWVCKTWEGEIAMVTLPGSVPEKFAFTVREDAVAAQLNQAVGQRVSLHYEQHVGVPGSCFGETDYWVTSVTVIPAFGGQPGPAEGLVPAAPGAVAPQVPPSAPSAPTPTPAPTPAPVPAPAAPAPH